jgi:hypothetical protein
MSICKNLEKFSKKTFPFPKICAIIIFAMRSKHIAALITFFVTFAFSAFIALLFAAPKIPYVPPVQNYEFKTYNNGCRKNTGDKIKLFLLRDKQNGVEKNEAENTLAAKSIAVAKYADESGSMDASSLPSDFQAAWREHMRAWRNYADVLQERRDKLVDADEYRLRSNEYLDDISSTWEEVLRIGREYGADLPAGF